MAPRKFLEKYRESLMEWAFKGLLGLLVTQGVSSIGEMRDSMKELNTKIAVVIEHSSDQDREINELKAKDDQFDHRMLQLERELLLPSRRRR